jgi:hypothetical protein
MTSSGGAYTKGIYYVEMVCAPYKFYKGGTMDLHFRGAYMLVNTVLKPVLIAMGVIQQYQKPRLKVATCISDLHFPRSKAHRRGSDL